MATAPTHLPKLGATEGATFLGGLGTAKLYGCTNVQIYLYFSNYRRDGFRMKFTVILLWIMDSLHMALTVVALWHYLIDSFGDYSALLAETWMVKLQSIVHIFGVLIVQTLYTARVWKLSLSLDHKVWPRTISMVLAAGYVVGILLSVGLYRSNSSLQIERYSWAIYSSLSVSTFLDFMIATAVCHLLSTCRISMAEAEMKSKVWVIMRYVVISGTLTSICSLSALITFIIMPNNLIFLGQLFMVSKLYVNSYLAMLNARNSLRGSESHVSRLEACRTQHVLPMSDMETRRSMANGANNHCLSIDQTESKYCGETVEDSVKIAVDTHGQYL